MGATKARKKRTRDSKGPLEVNELPAIIDSDLPGAVDTELQRRIAKIQRIAKAETVTSNKSENRKEESSKGKSGDVDTQEGKRDAKRPPQPQVKSYPSFQAMGLKKALVTAAKKCGYEEPTGIQSLCIVPILERRHLIACAVTGTGKTAGFLLPVMHNVLEAKAKNSQFLITRVLILTPTRELANQTHQAAVEISGFLPTSVSSVPVIGGASEKPQILAMKRKVDIVIACPGRLLELREKFPKHCSLKGVTTIVLDEADKMLQMGFQSSVLSIIKGLPHRKKPRQVLLFSATFAKIGELGSLVSPDAVQILNQDRLKPRLPKTLNQALYTVRDSWESKKKILTSLLRDKTTKIKSAIVFAQTKEFVDHIAAHLERSGVKVGKIHSDRSQGQRNTAVKKLQQRETSVLVATNILARGIDFPHLTHVVNFTVPTNPWDYAHRVGRAARNGTKGSAITLMSSKEHPLVEDIEKKLGSIERKVLKGFDYEWAGPAPGTVLRSFSIMGTRKRRKTERWKAQQARSGEQAGQRGVPLSDAAGE